MATEVLAPPGWVLARKVPTDDRDAMLTRHFTSVKNGLFVFQDLMSEVVSGLVPALV